MPATQYARNCNFPTIIFPKSGLQQCDGPTMPYSESRFSVAQPYSARPLPYPRAAKAATRHSKMTRRCAGLWMDASAQNRSRTKSDNISRFWPTSSAICRLWARSGQHPRTCGLLPTLASPSSHDREGSSMFRVFRRRPRGEYPII